MIKTDFLIIGAGIVGISIARELKRRFPDQHVILIEKEADVAKHASGRNSGVLHAGFYYDADSLKAKLTREGNLMMSQYCQEHKLPFNRCGKLVVARSESDFPILDELYARAQANNVEVQMVTTEEAREIEPRVKTVGRALYSPTSAAFDPVRVMGQLKTEALMKAGIRLQLGIRYLRRGSRDSNVVLTDLHAYEAGYVINAAGLYADVVARDFGFGHRYRILPFRGMYVNSKEMAGGLHTHIYPAPNLANPFLGIHFILTPDEHIKIGPSASPGLWREHYDGLDNFSLGEFFDIVFRQLGVMLGSGVDIPAEISKHSIKHMVELGSEMVDNVDPDLYPSWGKPGIRAQLYDILTRRLEMDFVLEGDNKSMHVLNAVSPAFTSSFAFARYIVSQIYKLAHGGQIEKVKQETDHP